jgi:acetyl esterase/lipase
MFNIPLNRGAGLDEYIRADAPRLTSDQLMTKSVRIVSHIVAACILASSQFLFAQSSTPKTSFEVTVIKPVNGSISIEPPIPADGKVAAGTVLNITAKPAKGYALDSGFYTGVGPWFPAYFESPTSRFQVVVDQNRQIGGSFIEQKALEGFKVIQDVVYAQPGVKKLKYDVYSPKGAKNLPCIVIIHGGGWMFNTEDIMRGLARELVRGGKYVVFSIDYRWIGTRDGDKTPNTMADIIGDVYGAIAHIQEHAKKYGADPTRIAVTGDSAGGHLSAAAIDMPGRIGDGGFGVKEGVYQFKPTYLPAGKSIDRVRQEITQAIKVAAPSYGVFSDRTLSRVMRDSNPPAAAVEAIAPMDNIPNIKERAVPQFLLRGTLDPLIKDEEVQGYAATFAKYGVPYAAKMEAFFDTVFYPK